MTWNTVWPNPAVSVKANATTGQANTNYITSTMNVDHYWDIGTDQDGHHKQVQMPDLASDVTLATGMDGAIWCKATASGRIQGYYRNAEGIYQFIPSFKEGTVSITSTSTYVTLTDVPDNCYGNLWVFKADSSNNMAYGFFKASGGVVQTYSCATQFGGGTDVVENLKFGNDTQASGLNLRARRDQASSGTYVYKVVYWAT